MKIAISLLIVLIVLLMVVLLWCCCCCRHGCCYSKYDLEIIVVVASTTCIRISFVLLLNILNIYLFYCTRMTHLITSSSSFLLLLQGEIKILFRGKNIFDIFYHAITKFSCFLNIFYLYFIPFSSFTRATH